ncbi:Histone deacetylase domain-containing protein [Artemisia annua]|uniref:Histone deacetylase domain-containing protein n=1 Tax=Artemisia annua TaxID=35608 RepID=A0A2U1QCX2_ARTAN|nr:Histone deacetylase domain-containing protein [Artemisia annua]
MERRRRVTYILDCLEVANLTPKLHDNISLVQFCDVACVDEELRGSEIIQLDNIRAATIEDITSVHSRAYISSLEKVKVAVAVHGVKLERYYY